jgi:hypothetical protein
MSVSFADESIPFGGSISLGDVFAAGPFNCQAVKHTMLNNRVSGNRYFFIVITGFVLQEDAETGVIAQKGNGHPCLVFDSRFFGMRC